MAVRTCATRFAALLLAVLFTFSGFSFSGGHAHAGTAGEAPFAIDHAHAANGEGHAHAVPCDDSGTEEGGQDSCCVSASSCGICAPVQSAGFAFFPQGAPPASVPISASLPRDPPALTRPPTSVLGVLGGVRIC